MGPRAESLVPAGNSALEHPANSLVPELTMLSWYPTLFCRSLRYNATVYFSYTFAMINMKIMADFCFAGERLWG